MFLNEILDSREGMTAELRYRPSDDRYSPFNRRANLRAFRCAKRQLGIHAPFARSSHRLHQDPVKLQYRDRSATLLVETLLVSPVSANSNDRFLASGAPATVLQHRTGGAAIY